MIQLLEYPFTVQRTEEKTYILQAVDVPEAMTEGISLPVALEGAAEALVLGLAFYIEAGEPIPMPRMKQAKAASASNISWLSPARATAASERTIPI